MKLGASNHQRGFRHVQFGTALVQLGAARWSGFKVVEEAPPRHKRFGFEMSPDNKFGFWSQHIHLCRHYSRPKGILKHSGPVERGTRSTPEGPECGCPDNHVINAIPHQLYDQNTYFHRSRIDFIFYVHTCTLLFTLIAKLGFRGNAQSTAVMLQPTYKLHTTSIL